MRIPMRSFKVTVYDFTFCSLNIHMNKYYQNEQFVFKHLAVSLCYGGFKGSAVQKFQTNVNVYEIGLFAIKCVK